MTTEFYEQVPRTMLENLQYRIEVRERAQRDAVFRQAVMQACAVDFLYWVATFAWAYEPRPRYDAQGFRLPKRVPFIPWDHQAPAFLKVRELLGFEDIAVEKCRDEGWSYGISLFGIHDWIFSPSSKVGIVSSTEAKSDDPGNMDSLGAKIDWQIAGLPEWMVGKQGRGRQDGDWYRNLGDHSFVHNRTKSQINLFAAGADTFRGGRYTWAALDEAASIEWQREQKDVKVLDAASSATGSRLFVSTPNGTTGAFYNIIHEPSNRTVVRIDWRDNPTKNRGLYRMEKGVPVAVDPVNNPLLPAYDPPNQETKDLFSRLVRKGFHLDRSTRSPWYDYECDRAGNTPQSIAKEQDRDYGGSMYRVFGIDFMDAATPHVRTPDLRGNFVFDDQLEGRFDRDPNGPFMLWTKLDVHGNPPQRDYIVAADVGAGQGGSYSSNSVIVVIDCKTREQVLEFATNTTKPDRFADIAMAIAQWFYGAHLAWEDMGPGVGFKAQVLNRGYTNLYYRMVQTGLGQKKTPKLGFINRGDARGELFSELHNAICTDDLIIHSKELLEEFPQYVWEKGEIKHVAGKSATDDSFGAAHGDRVIAMGVAFQALKNRPTSSNKKKDAVDYSREPAYGSLAWRRWLGAKPSGNDIWDKRTSADLTKPIRR